MERLREDGRGRTIVVVGIAHPVRVELDLTVVEVEVRGVVELAIGVQIIAFACPCHRKLSLKKSGFLPEFYSTASADKAESALGKSKQYLLNATRSWKP